MRKLVAILILAIFAFNVAGYQLVFNYFSGKADTNLELALDQYQYNDDQLVSIKQPTNLPYYSNSKEFQRIDGQVEMNGVQYKYVKCRVYNDTLEIFCIPNKTGMQIEQNKIAYGKVANDFQQNDTSKKDSRQKSFQKLVSEFEEQLAITVSYHALSVINTYLLVKPFFDDNAFFTPAEQPPDHTLI